MNRAEPMDVLTSMGQPNQVQLPSLFIRFIGVCEVLGALGLILPGLFRVKTWLTPLAAAGLVIIMIGAVAVSLKLGIGAAVFPFVVGLLLAFVAYHRLRPAPFSQRCIKGHVCSTVESDVQP